MRGLLFDLMSTRQRWLGQREAVLTRNVANADTPAYQPLDLKPAGFARLVAQRAEPAPSVGLSVTQASHLAGSTLPAAEDKARKAAAFETTPSGNAVVLDQQMHKLTQTQLDYELTTNLYRRQIGLFKTALGAQQG